MAAATNRFLTSIGPIFFEVKRTDVPFVTNQKSRAAGIKTLVNKVANQNIRILTAN
jgi:hypothetical protein